MLQESSEDLSGGSRVSAPASAIPFPAIVFLLLTLGVILLWSHYQMMWTDEFYPLQNDSVPTLSRVAEIQMKTPTSLDPLTYNILAHEAIGIFGVTPFAIRLPSFIGFLLMQVCLFFFVRRIAGERAATFAMALPALTAVLAYAVQARPNGLLLGLCALVMLSWQTATRKPRRRTLPLAVLAVALFVAINTHYYAVLILVPLCGAELLRAFQMRRCDWPVVASILLGMTGTLALLPFMPALAAFRTNYYSTSPIVVQFITHSYIWMFLGDSHLTLRTQHLLAVAGVVFLALFVKSSMLYRRRGGLNLPSPELLFVLLFAALPVFGFLLTYFVTKVIEVRYIIPAVAGVAASMAILLACVLQKDIVYRATIVVIFASFGLSAFLQIRTVLRQAQALRESLVLLPQTRRGLDEYPGLPIYTSNPATYQIEGYYSPDADVRSRIALLYSADQEMRRMHDNYIAMTSAHMKANGSLRVDTFESLRSQTGVHLMLLPSWRGDWINGALAESHARFRYLGPMLGYNLFAVYLPAAQAAAPPPTASAIP